MQRSATKTEESVWPGVGHRFRTRNLSIGTRLAVSFAAIIGLMMAADAVAVWQFRRMEAVSRDLRKADQTSRAVVRVRLDINTFRKRVALMADSQDTREFASDSASLRNTFLHDVETARQLLIASPELNQNGTISSALETLRVALPAQLDTVIDLANAGDWTAVRLRIGNQIQDLIDLTSSQVEKVDQQVLQAQNDALERSRQSRRNLLLAVPIAALLALLAAAALGLYLTRSIIVPLSELASGAHALARGDFRHEVNVGGNDELAVLGKAFNHAARQLRELYEELREQASLLSLTHDAVYVRDMKGVIRYWNRGAEVLYGWPAEHAVGEVAREFLKAVFPLPFQQIEAELLRTGRWEGELVKTKKDGTQLVVASRWSLKPDDRGEPVAILVTSNDITERKRAEEGLRRLNRELRAISNCNQTLLRATDEQSLLEEICRIVVQEAGYRMAWVGYAEHDEAQSVRPVAWTGAEEGYLATLGITWADTERGRGPTGTAIRSGITSCVQDFATDPRLLPWRESVLQHGYRSGIALPLKDEHGNAFGSLTIYSAQPNAFTSEEIRLLEELAGDLAFGIVTLRSQAARKRAEEALRESETRFRTFVDHAGDALFVYDLEQRTVVDVNREACESLGYSREELIGKTPLDFHPDSYQAEMESVVERRAAGETVFDTHWHRRKDGSMFPVEVHATLVSYGGRRFLLTVARDISDRVRAEEAIRQSGRQLRDVIEGIPAIASTVSLDGSFEFLNKRWQEYTGTSVEEGLGSGWQSAIHPKDIDHCLEEMRAALASGDAVEYEARILSREGEYRWFLLRGVPLRDERGNIVKWYATAIDIEDRKQAEEVRLEERVRERTRIARELHDTLLQSFHGLLLRFQTVSCLLPERPVEAKEKLDRAIDQAAEAITEGRDAVQGLRDSIVQGNDLAMAISTLGEELAADSTSHRPAFRVAVEGESRNLHPIVRDEIYKIAAEALRNAFRHAQARQIEVEIRYDKEQFRLRVRDDGKGIDPAVLSRQGSEGHYGLPGMRERATIMGAKLTVWSEVDAGTEVELRVPPGASYATAWKSP